MDTATYIYRLFALSMVMVSVLGMLCAMIPGTEQVGLILCITALILILVIVPAGADRGEHE